MTPALIERLKEASERFDGKRIFEIRQGCSVEHAADLVALKAVAQEAAAELSRLHQSEAELRAALEGVLRVADRATDEFDAARATLGESKK